MGIFGKIFGSYSTKELARIEPIKESVLKLEEQYAAMSDTELKAQTQNFRDRLDTWLQYARLLTGFWGKNLFPFK